MKIATLGLIVLSSSVMAQVQLDLGGDGSYGPLNVTSDTTITLPPDGVLQVTTMNVAAGATLSFTPNLLNTAVTIVATGDVVINGVIDVSGAQGAQGVGGVGGPGGGRGGPPALGGGNFQPEFPIGPLVRGVTGGRGGMGSYPIGIGAGCTVHGAGGSGGGGAIFIRSNTAIRSTTSGALINAGTKPGSTLSPTNPSSPSSCSPPQVRATEGVDGSIRLVAPVVEAATLTLIGAQNEVRVDRLSGTSSIAARTFSNFAFSPQYGASMVGWSLPPFSTRILSIDSTMVPTTASSYQYNYSPSASSTTVITNVSGCQGPLTVALEGSGFVGQCIPDQASYTLNTNATTTWSCPLTASTVSSGRMLFYAYCVVP